MLHDIGELVGNNNNNNNNNNKNDSRPKYWKMKNGYALPSRKSSIKELSYQLRNNSTLTNDVISKLRVGVHWNTEVYMDHDDDDDDDDDHDDYSDYDTVSYSSSSSDPTTTTRKRGTVPRNSSPPHIVGQVYCSAVPIGYDYTTSVRDWEPFAQCVLDGLYEATLAVGAITALRRQRKKEDNDNNDSKSCPIQRPRVKVFLTMVGGGVFANRPQWIAKAINKALVKFKDHPLDVFPCTL